MVDDRAMRFRQQAAAPAPRFSAPSNYRYGEASAPRAAKPNAVTDFLMPFTSQTMRSGEDIGAQDLLKDAAMYAAGGLIGKGIGTGLRAIAPQLRKAAYVSNSPVVKETLGGRHFGPESLSMAHPRDVPVVDARTAGAGTYFANGGGANSLRLRLPGDRSSEYSVPLSFMDRYKLANSQGYAGPDDVARAVNDLGLEDTLSPSQAILPLNDAGFDSPIIQDLLKKGFVGFNQGKNSFPVGEFTNWLVGANDIGRINSKLPQLTLRNGPANVDDITRVESILRRIVPPQ